MFSGLDDDDCVSLSYSVDRFQAYENDGVVPSRDDAKKITERESMLVGPGKPKRPSRINGIQGVGAKERTIASLANFSFLYDEPITREDHSQTGRQT